MDATVKEFSKPMAKFLGTKADFIGQKTGSNGTFNLIDGTGINLYTQRLEKLQDRGVGAGLHCEANGEPERVGEGKRQLRLCLKHSLVVDEEGGAKCFAGLASLGRR